MADAVAEGDMLLPVSVFSTSRGVFERRQGQPIDRFALQDYRNAANRPWPSRHIPYRIDYELGESECRRWPKSLITSAVRPTGDRTNDIDAALKMITFHTCLSFHQRTSEADYIFFKSGFGCASYVGFMGGKQEVHVAATCKVGNIVHEVLHALGFFHEHTRLDRGKYINILSSNIMQDSAGRNVPASLRPALHHALRQPFFLS
ncbi:astacin-like metalloendopeptidase isoform X7 [Syngnathus typhle]|uniref:astacin-like metalloendopeptidase isoform X7 n=1 Tax=Syngnathus typhle TaxID=161592 RepID=UPI002A6A9FDC|nr:astacin-like metalloendopeptidase isoform X7 [Syngnathus typhle]